MRDTMAKSCHAEQWTSSYEGMAHALRIAQIFNIRSLNNTQRREDTKIHFKPNEPEQFYRSLKVIPSGISCYYSLLFLVVGSSGQKKE